MLEVAGGVRTVERGPLRYRAVLRLILRCGGHGTNATPGQLGAIPARSSDLTDLDQHRAGFLEALLARDSARARHTIEAAMAMGVPVPDLYLGVLEPALREVGHRWAMGEINIADEHYATAVAHSILDGLSRRLPRAPLDGRLAIGTGTPGEQHTLGGRGAGDRPGHGGGTAPAGEGEGGGLPRAGRLGGADAGRRPPRPGPAGDGQPRPARSVPPVARHRRCARRRGLDPGLARRALPAA